MDFVRALSELGQTCETIHGIQEGYWYSGEEDRAVLTPMWEIETDQGTFLLDCAQGASDQGDVRKAAADIGCRFLFGK